MGVSNYRADEQLHGRNGGRVRGRGVCGMQPVRERSERDAETAKEGRGTVGAGRGVFRRATRRALSVLYDG